MKNRVADIAKKKREGERGRERARARTSARRLDLQA